VRSIPDPGPPTLAEAVEGLAANIREAAQREQVADQEARTAELSSPAEASAIERVKVARIDQLHWRDYLRVYLQRLELHPDLADKPIGTKCSHGSACQLDSPRVRETGADDADAALSSPYQDSRLPPEKDQPDLPF
jgi:hypothetical protein